MKLISLLNLPLLTKKAHPHDLLTRFYLFDTELFASLVKNYGKSPLIKSINFDTLKCESPVIIDNNLKELVGDLIFTTQFIDGSASKILLFFEHQSTKKEHFWLHCIKKIIGFYEQFIADPKNMIGNGGEYPFPLVVILYNGEIPWGDFLQLNDLLSLPPEVDRKLLWFPVIFIDLTQINVDDFDGHAALKSMLDSLQSARTGTLLSSFDRIFDRFNKIKYDPRTDGWMRALLSYFLTITEPSQEIVVRAISKIIGKMEAKNMFMSTLEKTYYEGEKKGKEEGREEGREEGKIKGKVETQIDNIIKLLKLRFRRVPESILRAVRLYSDPIALDSLFEHAAT
ncbi:MAG: Rpn family recombination-promoting nuclease/putative transposase, partial [Planctomycetaceae bacterium]|nr:Rpn family recombination-promoting nuclease/putative transposase [Planctomycetaceae bacterium]